MQVGIVTCHTLLPFMRSEESPLLTIDDAHLVTALRARGHEVVFLPWQDGPLPTPLPDVVLVRSPWDYTEDLPAFLAWLAAIEAQGVPLFHGHELCAWNSNKRYLSTLEAAGVPIVPTRYLAADEGVSLCVVMAQEGWDEMVLKPSVGAGGRDTFRMNSDEAFDFAPRFAGLRGERDWMMQPFLKDILSEGEWSLLFWPSGYSHAVRKFAKPGEFRVQDDHGGRVEFADAPDWLQAQAQAACDAIPFPWLYARVDGVVVEGQFLLMELELIEPELFFRASPAAPSGFIDALFSRLDIAKALDSD